MTALLRTTLSLALAMLPLTAQAGPDPGHRAERISRALGLTEDQKTSIRAIREKHRPDLTLRRDAVRHARIDLRTALQDPATPEARLRDLYNKASAVRFDLILAQRATRLEVQAVLTPDQRARAAEIRVRRQGRHPRVDPGMAG